MTEFVIIFRYFETTYSDAFNTQENVGSVTSFSGSKDSFAGCGSGEKQSERIKIVSHLNAELYNSN